jgi:hypothetical protein
VSVFVSFCVCVCVCVCSNGVFKQTLMIARQIFYHSFKHFKYNILSIFLHYNYLI